MTAVSCDPLRAGGSTLTERFRVQAMLRGGSIAVIDATQSLTYEELDRRATGLAQRLVRNGVAPRDVVGVCVERSVDLVVALLGTLKAGAAYLPLDPTYPAVRADYMLTDSGAGMAVIGDGIQVTNMATAVAKMGCHVIALRDDGSPEGQAELPYVTGDSPAYVIYTSGTTGKPKGVAIEHRNVTSLLDAVGEYELGPADVWTLFHSVAFDFSVWEIWGALLFGGRLVVVDDEIARDPDSFVELLRVHEVTILNQTPSAFRMLLPAISLLPQLRLIIFGGEPLDIQTVRAWYARHGERVALYNMYGITETTVHVTSHRLSELECAEWAAAGTPVGKPLENAYIRLLDPISGESVEDGRPGEICVGGPRVACGYLRKPRLTAERFVPDPATGAILYRSGDMGRISANGEIIHLGRNDSQVKIRGFRIEVGEVEAALDGLEEVSKSIVTVDGEGPAARLIAHVVPSDRAAEPVRVLLEMREAGEVDHADVLELPNGAAVVHASIRETEFLYDQIYRRATYARHGIVIPDGGCVFDVGANIGIFSLWASEQAEGVTLFAFESRLRTCEILKRNLKIHGLHARVENFGIGRRDEEASFGLFPYDTALSKRFKGTEERAIAAQILTRETAGMRSAASEETLDARMRAISYHCPFRRLSTLIADAGVERIDLLKIDVENAEIDILEGISHYDWPKIQQVALEVHDHANLSFVTARLRGLGYSLVQEEDDELRDPGPTKVFARRNSTYPGGSRVALPKIRGPGPFGRSLRQSLASILPPQHVPSEVRPIARLPLTANGKVDRAALADHRPPSDEPVRTSAMSETEEAVASAFAEALGCPVRDGHANFFELGGQSLSAIAVTRSLRARFGNSLPMSLLFRHSSVSDLASAIDQRVRTGT